MFVSDVSDFLSSVNLMSKYCLSTQRYSESSEKSILIMIFGLYQASEPTFLVLQNNCQNMLYCLKKSKNPLHYRY